MLPLRPDLHVTSPNWQKLHPLSSTGLKAFRVQGLSGFGQSWLVDNARMPGWLVWRRIQVSGTGGTCHRGTSLLILFVSPSPGWKNLEIQSSPICLACRSLIHLASLAAFCCESYAFSLCYTIYGAAVSQPHRTCVDSSHIVPDKHVLVLWALWSLTFSSGGWALPTCRPSSQIYQEPCQCSPDTRY